MLDFDITAPQAAGSSAKTPPPSIAAAIDAMWAERVEAVTGHADYAALAAELTGS